jgi:hypothetical protein
MFNKKKQLIQNKIRSEIWGSIVVSQGTLILYTLINYNCFFYTIITKQFIVAKLSKLL